MKVVVLLAIAATVAMAAAPVRSMDAERSKRVARNIHGAKAVPGQFPYQAVVVPEDNKRHSFCSGVLVSDICVVTLAYCVVDMGELIPVFVRLGTTDVDSGDEYKVARVIVHPDYNPNGTRNNIALILLSKAVQQSSTIAPVDLPSSAERNITYVNQTGVVSGYGVTIEVVGIYGDSGTLNYVNQTVKSDPLCQFFNQNLDQETIICAGSLSGKNPCAGDAGSPLVIQNNNRSVLVGIVAHFPFILECDNRNRVITYTRISAYIDFINQNL